MKRDYTLATVEKTLDILEYLSHHREEHGLQELGKALHIPKATLFRYLVTLEGRGYVRRTPTNGRYSLGFKILELSDSALRSSTLHELALPRMRELLDRFQETVNLAVLEENQIVYVQILESPRPFKMVAQVGARDFPHSTSLGKAMLAFLPEEEVERITHATGFPKRTEKTISSLHQLREELAIIRRRGYAIDAEENEEGACCVGAPILDRRANVVAALSFSGPMPHFSSSLIDEMGAALVELTGQISREMGYLSQE